MKKIIVLLIISVVFLAACGQSAGKKPSSAKQPEKTTEQTASAQSKTAEVSDNKKEAVSKKPQATEVSDKETKSAAKPSEKGVKATSKKVAAPKVTPITHPKTFYVSVSSANVRKGPGTSHPGIGVVKKGTKLSAEKETKSGNTTWYYISNQKGWISSSVLTTKKPVIATVPKPATKTVQTKTTQSKTTQSKTTPDENHHDTHCLN